MKIIFCDICGTIFYSNTTYDFINYYIKSHSFSLFRIVFLNVFSLKINALINYILHIDVLRILLISYLKGYSKQELVNASENFYNEVLKSKINTETISVINSHRKMGYQLCLVSATLDFIADTVGRFLNAEVVYSTKLLYDNNICLGKIDIDLLGRKHLFLGNNKHHPPYSVVITDDFSDVSLIKNAERSFIVTYSSRIERWKKKMTRNKVSANNYSFLIKI